MRQAGAISRPANQAALICILINLVGSHGQVEPVATPTALATARGRSIFMGPRRGQIHHARERDRSSGTRRLPVERARAQLSDERREARGRAGRAERVGGRAAFFGFLESHNSSRMNGRGSIRAVNTDLCGGLFAFWFPFTRSPFCPFS